jgi:SpoVK/Ycf46/Vps4 family AAA+-type ATPase
MGKYKQMKNKEQLSFFVDFINVNSDKIKNDPTDVNEYCKSEYKKIDRSITYCEQINLDSPYKSLTDIESVISPENLNDTQHVKIDQKIESLDDLIELLDKNPLLSNVSYNINMKSIHNIKDDLIKLNNMVGMRSLKNNIIDQIVYFVQGLHTFEDKNDGDFLHTVIYGPPGTGKTEVAKIMGSIYSKLGILNKNIFKKATRSDLIAGYLGQTAMKTRDLIESCIGGVLFIDEAYSLGNEEKRDSFAKEALDTLCEALSDHKKDLMVIIAGYEDELKTCFFSFNQGLESRFTWRFKTQDYSPEEMKMIFNKKVEENNWKLKNIPVSWFEKNMDYFRYFGRDMETLFSKTKIAHSRRVFCLDDCEKKIITIEDMDKGFEKYLDNDEIKKRKEQKEFNKILKNTLYC